MFLSVSLGIPFHEVRQWSAAEILLYQCYYQLAPWGDDRADIRTANQTAFIAKATGVTKQGGGDFALDDFMPFRDRAETETEGEPVGLRDAFRALTAKK